MRGLRVAIATDWFAPRRGGIEAQLAQLATGLASRGYSVDVLTSTPQSVDGDGYRVRRLDVATLPTSQLAVSPRLLPALRRELERGYDVVHAHVSVVSPVGYAAAMLARSLRLPTVVTFHSVLRQKRFLLRAANATGALGRSAAIWSAVSSLVAGQVREAIPAAQVHVLPNGIDTAFWAAANGQRRARDVGAITLVSAMRLHRKKRPRELLRAFMRAVEQSGLRARLCVVGDGPERHALEQQARQSDHAGDIQFLGWLERSALRSLYAEADGFVLASTRESFGIAALEARASGLPVIAMTASGASEFLTHDRNALLCADDAALALALGRFVGDSGLRARLTTTTGPIERYDWSTVLSDHEAVYRRAMRRAADAVAPVAVSE